MKFKTLLTKKTKLPAEVHKLFPSSYQAIGDICLIKMSDWVGKRYGHQLGGIILDNFPQFRTVCWLKEISGEFRQPKVELLAGEKNTEVVHHELNCAFKLDVSKIMWSKGNHFERKRIVSLIKKGEIVVDMFAGIGYWSIPIARHTKAKQIFAIEKNKISFNYLQQNIKLNYIPNIAALLGDCRNEIKKLPRANRIILGYFPNTIKFLPAALEISKKGTIIHFHELTNNLEKLKKEIIKFPVKIQNVREVKEYSPSKRHYVFDLVVK